MRKDVNRELEFAMNLFREYYRKTPPPAPADLREREFGFMFFDRDFVKRHTGFLEENDFRRFLLNQVPSHAYYSTALYERPSAPTMDLKGWKGADLIFDLDADHIRGAEKLSYQDMLVLVKKEAMTLLDRYILGELGFDERYVRICFSGGRGYHVYVHHPKLLALGSHERGEIIDLVNGTDLNMELIFPSAASMRKDFKDRTVVKRSYSLPAKDQGGWLRFGRQTAEKVANEIGVMSNDGLRQRYPSLLKVKDQVLNDMRQSLYSQRGDSTGLDLMLRNDSLEYLTSDRARDSDHLKELFMQMVLETLKERMSGQIDEPVTRDVKRLIRLPGSLHGKTGLRVVTLTREQMDDFDPLRDAVPEAFPSTPIKVHLKERTDVRIKDFRVNGEGDQEVPTYAALFLVLRRWAALC
jgi:DNA primase small subunit